jgi:hypothetical protein
MIAEACVTQNKLNQSIAMNVIFILPSKMLQRNVHRPGDMLGLKVQVSLKRAGREMRMLVENADDQTPADPSLLRESSRALTAARRV